MIALDLKKNIIFFFTNNYPHFQRSQTLFWNLVYTSSKWCDDIEIVPHQTFSLSPDTISYRVFWSSIRLVTPRDHKILSQSVEQIAGVI